MQMMGNLGPDAVDERVIKSAFDAPRVNVPWKLILDHAIIH